MLNAIFLIWILQAPTVLQSQQAGFPIVGRLQFHDNVQATPIEILLESDEGVVIDRTMSSPNGEFRFNGVRLGRYWIVIEGEKFGSIRERLDLDMRTFGIVNVTLDVRGRFASTSKGDPVVSLDELRRKIPGAAVKEFEKGMNEFRKGKEKSALSHLEKSINIAPEFFEAHLQLGLLRQREGDRESAIRSLERAVALNATSAAARTSLAKLYFETDQFQKVVDVLGELVRLGLANAETHFYLGSAYYKLNALDAAEQNLSRALTISPDTMGQAHLQLFNVYMKSRQPGKALDQLLTYLNRFPNAPDHETVREQADRLRRALERN